MFPQAIGGLAYPGDRGVLSSLVPTDFNGVVPRVGFAYDVFGTGKLAVRGGFPHVLRRDQVLSTFGNNANTSTVGRKMQFSGTVYF